MKVAVTAVFWLLFLVTSPLCLLLGAALWLCTAAFDPRRRALHAFISAWTHAYLQWNPGWDVRVLHRERLPVGPCVLVANHQSMADIPALFGLRTPFKFVSKASLFRVPIVGWLMSLARYVRVERGRHSSMRQMLDACRAWLRLGEPVLIFPEGTYSGGRRMLPFRRGAFALAVEAGVPVVPVRVDGTYGLVEGDGPWVNARARVRVTVLPPIAPPTGDDAVDQLQRLTREALEAAEPA